MLCTCYAHLKKKNFDKSNEKIIMRSYIIIYIQLNFYLHDHVSFFQSFGFILFLAWFLLFSLGCFIFGSFFNAIGNNEKKIMSKDKGIGIEVDILR